MIIKQNTILLSDWKYSSDFQESWLRWFFIVILYYRREEPFSEVIMNDVISDTATLTSIWNVLFYFLYK